MDPDPLTINDDALTKAGLSAASVADVSGRVMLLACGALAREILALTRLNGWSHLDLACLPAQLHNEPKKIPEAVRAKVRDARARGYANIYVVYADCGTGGLLDKVCAEEGVERIAGPHCYSFFDGNDAFADRSEAGEITAFYLTDFLARQFDTLIWEGLGLARHPELLPMMFGNYEKVIYLAQTDDPVLEAKARAAAVRLGLAFEMRKTGYGDLTEFLAGAAAD
jgi:hypothetical protein